MARGDPQPASGRVAGSPAPDCTENPLRKWSLETQLKSGLHVTVNAAAIVTLKNRTLSPVAPHIVTFEAAPA
jgi:hypothetical protein